MPDKSVISAQIRVIWYIFQTYLYSMQFDQIINAKIKNESDRPQMRKDLFPVSERLQKYLQKYGRDIKLTRIVPRPVKLQAYHCFKK